MSSIQSSVEAEISEAMKGLSKDSQASVARQLYNKYQSELGPLYAHREKLNKQVEDLKILMQWIDDGAKPVLGRKEHSSFHKFKQADAEQRIRGNDNQVYRIPGNVLESCTHTFVVKHDWAGALEGSGVLEGEVKLPYDVCAFEFMISGWTVIATAFDHEGLKFGLFTECANEWYVLTSSGVESELVKFVEQQIRSLCVALDAEIATHEVVRAPVKLNEKRAKKGKPPLLDYHVIDLARRSRISNPSHGQSGRKVRLHFRRGHWRHFETFKTWVRWCLVGDPDLGFVAKHYSL